MSKSHFSSYSVANLQKFLKDRGVVFGEARKPALLELCLFAKDLGIEIDPDGLREDRIDVISGKLTCPSECFCLRNPDRLSGAPNLSMVPNIAIFDIYNYLMTFNEFDHAKLRAYHQMEGYTMAKDGYVVYLETIPYVNTGHVAVKAHLKPRTNDKDPVSKKGYYSCWIIMKNSTEGSIKSAYCTCKGGIDGCCRHVVATLFEVLDFIEDFKNTSCTSGPCLWVCRASKADQIGKVVSAIEIDTSVTVNSSRGAPVPVYSPLPMDFPHPEPNVFFDRLKELQPNACALRAIFDCSSCTEPTHSLSCATPIEKAQQFVQEHTCIADSCKCSNIFVYYNLLYSPLECDVIEKSTRGQANNDNWHKMRKGLLTASNFHKIIHSTNLEKTVQSLLCGNSFDHTYALIILGLRPAYYTHKIC